MQNSSTLTLSGTFPRISSRKVIVVLTGLFLCGAAVGAMVDHLFQAQQTGLFLDRSRDVPALTARIEQKMAADYHLTPDQQVELAPLIHTLAQHVHDLRHQFGDEVIAALQRDHARIAEKLDPEQRAAYELANRHHLQRLHDFFLDHPATTALSP